MTCRAAGHLIWAMGEVGWRRDATITAAMQTYGDQFMAQLPEAELARVLRGFAKLGYEPDAFLNRLAGEAPQRPAGRQRMLFESVEFALCCTVQFIKYVFVVSAVGTWLVRLVASGGCAALCPAGRLQAGCKHTTV